MGGPCHRFRIRQARPIRYREMVLTVLRLLLKGSESDEIQPANDQVQSETRESGEVQEDREWTHFN